MENNYTIQVDSRENRNEHVLEQFTKLGYTYVTSKLYVGDYTFIQKSDIVVDRKKDMLEIGGNICDRKEHQRFKQELINAQENGIKLYILIEEENISCIDMVKYYQCPRYKSNGYKNGIFHHKGEKMSQINFEALGKAMATMQERYGCTFLFARREDFGRKILEILLEENEK